MLTRRKNQQDAKNNLIPVDEEDHVSEDVSSLNRYIIPVPVDGYGLIRSVRKRLKNIRSISHYNLCFTKSMR